MRFLYLHGFASSPSSRKARFFATRLAEAGYRAEVLDLAPDFRHLTISSQLDVIKQQVGDAPAVLIGSSMGGYLAALYAVRHPNVERVVLMAPAFDFYQLWTRELGPERLADWRQNGSLAVFHYGLGHHTPLDYGMLEDAKQYEAFPDVKEPCLIFHGLNDRTVPYELSKRFAEGRPNVSLVSFPSDHELTDVLEGIWQASQDFLMRGSTNRLEAPYPV